MASASRPPTHPTTRCAQAGIQELYRAWRKLSRRGRANLRQGGELLLRVEEGAGAMRALEEQAARTAQRRTRADALMGDALARVEAIAQRVAALEGGGAKGGGPGGGSGGGPEGSAEGREESTPSGNGIRIGLDK